MMRRTHFKLIMADIYWKKTKIAGFASPSTYPWTWLTSWALEERLFSEMPTVVFTRYETTKPVYTLMIHRITYPILTNA